MAIAPVVRYMLLCEDWRADGPHGRRVNIIGLLWNIRALDDPPYPLLYREFCVFLALTEGRKTGNGHIVCVFEDTGETVFSTPPQPISFANDPLAVVGVSFRIRDCTFPRAGRYSVQFWFEGTLVEERPLTLR